MGAAGTTFPAVVACRATTSMRSMRLIVKAILYPLCGSQPWLTLPSFFPPISTIRRWFYPWRDNGAWQTLNHSLMMTTREIHCSEASPSADAIDSRSVKNTESAGGEAGIAVFYYTGNNGHNITSSFEVQS